MIEFAAIILGTTIIWWSIDLLRRRVITLFELAICLGIGLVLITFAVL